MRIGIAFKLFIALLGAGIVMAAAMGVASRLTFRSGFLGYLNDLETQRVALLSASLAELYREQGGGQRGWAFLNNRDDEWRRILRNNERAFRASRESAERPEGSRPGGEAGWRTSLLDAERRVVVGNRRVVPDAQYGAIEVDGRKVGWVASVPFRELTDAADLTFQRKQEAAAWFIAALAVLLAGATAWLLGRIFLAPARQLALATHRLAEGHYDTRVAVASSDELGRLGADFNRLADTLARNERMRRAFMADVSHELRTPLAIMRGELEAIEDGLLPMDRRAVQSLQAEVASLAKLVDDIHQLAVADVGALQYSRAPVDLGDAVRGAVATFADRAAQHGLALEVAGQAAAPVLADRDRLAQVFANLFENAARYAGGSRERPVPLRIDWARQDGRAVLTVDDGGPGVAPGSLPKLFDRFYREESSRNRATGGSGLGLAICRSIVTALGGSIVAEPSPLGGLRIRIDMPLAGAADGGK